MAGTAATSCSSPTRNLATLLDHRFRRTIEAKRGVDGAGSNMAGANAPDEIVRVPVGTVISASDAGPDDPPLADLSEPGQRFIAVRGGSGGFGNARFTTATRQTPDFAKPGTTGESAQAPALAEADRRRRAC